MDKKRNIALALAITTVIFIIDIRTPVGYANWLLYFVPLFVAAPGLRRDRILVLPSAATVLIIASYFLSPPGGHPAAVAANRGMGIFIFWWISFIMMKRRQAEEALERSYEELEERVADRTVELSRANASLRKEIAERKRAEEAQRRTEENLKETMRELERSNRDLEQFGYAVSHDLQEPLRTVSGYVDLLSQRYKGKLDEKADRYISHAVDGTSRMSALINDLLAYARVGTRGARFASVDMNSVFTRTAENLKTAIEENHAAISVDRLPIVTGDETQLVQLLQNLIGNAIKFRKKDAPPRIRVSAERQGNQWVFGVHDNGIGIEPRYAERIFAVFQRLHTREEYPGTGVGLAICKRIVERHGGRIWVESKPGEGSVFYFTLPSGP